MALKTAAADVDFTFATAVIIMVKNFDIYKLKFSGCHFI
jgi:hypothetical protein